jgi:hypothetical protein
MMLRWKCHHPTEKASARACMCASVCLNTCLHDEESVGRARAREGEQPACTCFRVDASVCRQLGERGAGLCLLESMSSMVTTPGKCVCGACVPPVCVCAYVCVRVLFCVHKGQITHPRVLIVFKALVRAMLCGRMTCGDACMHAMHASVRGKSYICTYGKCTDICTY